MASETDAVKHPSGQTHWNRRSVHKRISETDARRRPSSRLDLERSRWISETDAHRRPSGQIHRNIFGQLTGESQRQTPAGAPADRFTRYEKEIHVTLWPTSTWRTTQRPPSLRIHYKSFNISVRTCGLFKYSMVREIAAQYCTNGFLLLCFQHNPTKWQQKNKKQYQIETNKMT